MIEKSNKSKHELEINGLRGLAIILVVLFHYEIVPFSGGFIGVDIFFVISGYLITKIILRKDYDDLSYFGFVKNRIRRIFPGLIIMIMLVTLTFVLILTPDHLTKLSHSVISNIFLIPNFYFWTQSDYFDISSSFKPILHTWSLGVEFHFYFLWPILLVFFSKFNSTKKINILIVFLIIISILFIEYIITKGPIFENKLLYGKLIKDTLFFLSPFRFFEFLFGSLLAINLARSKNNFLNETIFILGLGLIFFSSVYISGDDYFPSLIALLPLFGVVFLIYSKEAKYSAYFLRNRFINFFGDISYSLYLYHWPVYVFFKYYKYSVLNLNTKFFAFLISLLLSYISFRFIEKYYLDKKNKIFDLRVNFSIIFLILAGLTINYYNGLDFRLTEKNLNVLNNKNNQYGGLCTDLNESEYSKKDHCLIGDRDNLDFLVVGDSHSKQYNFGLENFSRKYNLNYLTQEGLCETFPNLGEIASNCSSDEKIPKNIIIGKWYYSYQMKDENIENIAKKYIQRIIELKKSEDFKNIENVIVIGQVPGFYSSYGDALSCFARPQYIIKTDCENYLNHEIYNLNIDHDIYFSFKQKKLMNTFLDKYSKLASNDKLKIHFFSPFDYLCKKSKCVQVIDNNLLYSDSTHLSKFGSNYLISQIEDDLFEILNKK